jgi:hypothetical protein
MNARYSFMVFELDHYNVCPNEKFIKLAFSITMVFTVEHKTFFIESYFQNGTKVGGIWVYLVQNYIEEFPNFAINHIQFKKTLDTAGVLRKR